MQKTLRDLLFIISLGLLLTACSQSSSKRTALPDITTTSKPETMDATSTPMPTLLPSPIDPLEFGSELAEQVDIQRLMSDVNWLANDKRRGRRTGSPEENLVGKWIMYRFQDLSLVPFAEAGLDSFLQAFQTNLGQGENVIGVLPGTTYPNSFVLLGAHYDHLGVSESGQVYNGADDDATGVAAVLEAAKLLSGARYKPQETIVFVAFSGEEMEYLGSSSLCEQLKNGGLVENSMLLNLEVLGAIKGKGTFLDVFDEGDSTTLPLVEAVERAGEKLDFPVKRLGVDPGSDAIEMLKCGIPASTIDVAWSFDNHPNLHDPSDDPEFIDESGLENAARVAVAAIWFLANDGQVTNR